MELSAGEMNITAERFACEDKDGILYQEKDEIRV